MLRRIAVAVLIVACAVPLPADDETGDERAAQLEERVRELEARLADMERRDDAETETAPEPDASGADEDDEAAALRREAEAAAAAGQPAEKPPAEEPASGRQRALQALNPEISYLGDVSYDWSDSAIQDRFLLRGAEISFQAALDPYTRFKGFLAAHQEPPALETDAQEQESEISVTLEESYVEWVALPLESRLRFGLFRQQYGTLNRWHPHALPSTDVPFALRNVFGHEGLAGLGVGLDLPLPRLWAPTNGLTVELVNADNESAFAGESFGDLALLLRHTGFFDLGPDSYVDLNLNWVHGPNDPENDDPSTTIYGADLNYVWEPVQRARYRGVEVRGEYILTRFERVADSDVRSQSFYAYLIYKLGQRFSVGLRYDDAELPWDRFELHGGQSFREGLRERAWTPSLTFWQSEFVRLRLQLQRVERDFSAAQGPPEDTLAWIQATFAGGPHRHEAF